MPKCTGGKQSPEFLYDGIDNKMGLRRSVKTNLERRHKVKGRGSFAFSDVRRTIAEAALDIDFHRLCPKPSNSPVNPFVAVLLRMVA